jgi:putative protease
LGREVTLEEIKEIKAKCPKLELEYFIHGAMCMAYSGRCFLSKEMTGRSANAGDCTQPCRWQYDQAFVKSKGHDDEFELVHEEHGSYLLNSKDLRLIEYIPKLLAAGVTAFKIEGRAKSAYYLANIVGIYRRALGSVVSLKAKKLSDELAFLSEELENKVTNRGYTTGFLLSPDTEASSKMQNQSDSKQPSAWEFCGQVISSKAAGNNQELILTVHNTLKTGDKAELVLPGYTVIQVTVGPISDAKTGTELSEAHGGAGRKEVIISIDSKISVPKGTVIRRFVNV